MHITSTITRHVLCIGLHCSISLPNQTNQTPFESNCVWTELPVEYEVNSLRSIAESHQPHSVTNELKTVAVSEFRLAANSPNWIGRWIRSHLVSFHCRITPTTYRLSNERIEDTVAVSEFKLAEKTHRKKSTTVAVSYLWLADNWSICHNSFEA